MAPQSCDRLTYIDKYGVDMSKVNFYGGALGRIGKSKNESLWDQFDPNAIRNQLQCTQNESHFQVKRFEYLSKSKKRSSLAHSIWK